MATIALVDPEAYDDRRELLFDYWCAYHLAFGTPPTTREAMAACDISSTSVVRYHIEKLIDEGRLVQVPGNATRTRDVVPADWKERACAAIKREMPPSPR